MRDEAVLIRTGRKGVRRADRLLAVAAVAVAAVLGATAALAVGPQPAQAGSGNRPPARPTELRTADTACATARPGPYLSPEMLNDAHAVLLRATVTDPDPDDALTAMFALWRASRPERRQLFTSPVTDSQALVQLEIPLADGVTYAWQVRAFDGHRRSPRSQTCYFTIDSSRPATPTVSSQTYPPEGVGGGPGVPGDFVFDPNGSRDVVRYTYRFSPEGGDDWQYVAADRRGRATVRFTPQGTDWSTYRSVAVQSIDRAGNFSEARVYEFHVRETRPLVFSEMYPPEFPNPAGNIGVPGVFTFTSAGVQAVSFRYRLDDGPTETIDADANHAAAVTLTPTRGGPHVLRVQAVDAEGVVHPAREYRFVVDTAPTLSGDVDRYYVVGNTYSFTATPRIAGVTEYLYWFTDDQGQPTPTTTVPAGPDGTATFNWTPTEETSLWLRVRSRSADGTLSEIRVMYAPVDGARPTVTVTGEQVFGEPLRFTFRTLMANPVEYEYEFTAQRGTVHTVAADPDGTATVTWTPPDGGHQGIRVWARNAAGVRTETGEASFNIDDTPIVTSAEFRRWEVGARLPGSFTFRSRIPDATEFVYQINSGPDATVAAGPDGTATIQFTPTADGFYHLQVQSRSADGRESIHHQYSFWVTSAPRVSSADYPEQEYSGGVGQAGTFTFAPGLPGVVEYTYAVQAGWGNEPGPEVTVAAGEDGRASISWTPSQASEHFILVRSRTADGSVSETAQYTFYVNYPAGTPAL
jgi:hypothetical protein